MQSSLQNLKFWIFSLPEFYLASKWDIDNRLELKWPFFQWVTTACEGKPLHARVFQGNLSHSPLQRTWKCFTRLTPCVQHVLMCLVIQTWVAAEVTRPWSPAVGDALRACCWSGSLSLAEKFSLCQIKIQLAPGYKIWEFQLQSQHIS